MVLLHVKKTDELQFLFETPVASKVDDTVAELVEIWNMQIQIRRLLDSMEDLAKYGPAKKPDKQCIDTYATDDWGNLINDKIERGPYYCMDPHGKRTGEAPEPRLAEIIIKEISNAKKVVNAKEHVERRQPVTKQYFQETLDSLRGAVMIAFPEGLPEWDDVPLIIKGEWEVDGRTMEALDEGAELWFANKQMEQGQDKLLSDFVGRNDKTKIICKLQKPGAGAPQREPAVDEKTQKEMMAFYHKKQEELKKLAEDDEDNYLGSKWADPRILKANLQGTGGVRFK
jgi:cilia- and flagella-associated protein 298